MCPAKKEALKMCVNRREKDDSSSYHSFSNRFFHWMDSSSASSDCVTNSIKYEPWIRCIPFVVLILGTN